MLEHIGLRLLGNVLEGVHHAAPPLAGLGPGFVEGDLLAGRRFRLGAGWRFRRGGSGCGSRLVRLAGRSGLRAGSKRLPEGRERGHGCLGSAFLRRAALGRHALDRLRDAGDGIGSSLLEHLGHVVHADIHVLQGAQRHFLHLERLDRGLEGGGVLLQPELHGTQFLDAAIDFFRIHGGGNPLRRRRRQRTRLRHLAQEIESGYELAEIKTGGVHGHGGSPVWLARIRQAYRKPLQPNRQAFPQTGSRAAGLPVRPLSGASSAGCRQSTTQGGPGSAACAPAPCPGHHAAPA